MLWLGMSFIYIPMILLVVYSFNYSKLVPVWGGWSFRWYVELFRSPEVWEAVLSIAQGIMQTMNNSVSVDNVVVLRSGATSEMMSGLSGDEARFISEGPGLVRNDQGAVASPELFVIINLLKKSTRTDANVPLRGVGPAAFEIREDFLVGRHLLFLLLIPASLRVLEQDKSRIAHSIIHSATHCLMRMYYLKSPMVGELDRCALAGMNIENRNFIH